MSRGTSWLPLSVLRGFPFYGCATAAVLHTNNDFLLLSVADTSPFTREETFVVRVWVHEEGRRGKTRLKCALRFDENFLPGLQSGGCKWTQCTHYRSGWAKSLQNIKDQTADRGGGDPATSCRKHVSAFLNRLGWKRGNDSFSNINVCIY
jgi:hypothetical protein